MNDIFSNRSAYKLDQLFAKPHACWKALQKSKLQEQLKMFCGSCARKALPLHARLNRQFHIPNISCPLCLIGTENFQHLVFSCPSTLASWFGSPFGVRKSYRQGIGIEDINSLIFRPRNVLFGDSEKLEVFLCVVLLFQMIFGRQEMLLYMDQSLLVRIVFILVLGE